MRFSYQAGCNGDLKSGVGNIELALSLERQGVAWGTASAALLALLAASFPARSVLARVGIAFGVGALGYIVLVAGIVQVS